MVRVRLLSFVMQLRKLAVGAGESAALVESFLSEWISRMVDEASVVDVCVGVCAYQFLDWLCTFCSISSESCLKADRTTTSTLSLID